MKISEVFSSIQGEGRLAGIPAVFVRTTFCNLRCRWCDTPYASWTPEALDLTVPAIVSQVESLAGTAGIRHIVLTGGEPLLQGCETTLLSNELSLRGYHVTLETNGTLFEPVSPDLISISPKLSNSIPVEHGDGLSFEMRSWHARSRLNLEALRLLLARCATRPGADVQVKFVIERESDLEEVRELAATVPIPAEKILLMPQVTDRRAVESAYAIVRRLCEKSGYAFSPRLHIERFGNRRGT